MVFMLDKLTEEGYLVFYKGGLLGMNKEDRLLSVYVFTEKWLALWAGVNVSKEKETFSGVQVRDRLTKQEVSTSRKGSVKDFHAFMDSYNEALVDTQICIGDKLLPVQQYVRIFSDNLSSGGRLYNKSGSIQTMPSALRKTISINGSKTTELDFKALHPNMLYEQLAQVTGKPIKISDPYWVSSKMFSVDKKMVEEYIQHHCVDKHDPVRNLMKQVMLRCLNSDSIKAAASSVTMLWYQEANKGIEGDFYGLVVQPSKNNTFPAKAVCEIIVDANDPIRAAFFTDVGIVLQRKDSEIIVEVLTKLLEIGSIGLSEHDSIVVEEKHKYVVNVWMEQAYKAVMGNSIYCKIEEKTSGA